MQNWIKTIMAQNNLQDNCYGFSSSSNSNQYETFRTMSKDLDKQLQEENRIFYLNILSKLGLKQDKDYDGKQILRSINNQERRLSRGDVKQLLNRVYQKKKNIEPINQNYNNKSKKKVSKNHQA